MRHVLVLPLVAFLSACGPSGGSQGHGGPGGMPPAQVGTITVQPKLVLAPFEYTGQTAGSREVEVRARVTGILLKRSFLSICATLSNGTYTSVAELLARISPSLRIEYPCAISWFYL